MKESVFVSDKTSLTQETFESWCEREHSRMIVTLLLTTGDLELASEGVDEACARALARWDRVATMEAPTGWVYRVAVNHARRLARRRSLEGTLLPRFVSPANMPADASEIWGLVATLPERQRQVVVLRHVGDLKEMEIAEVLRISRSTVSTTLRDAHHRLGALLDDAPGTNLDGTKEIADV
jgi:RNA polymerase sigma-70 factor (ECF subfamily)